MKNPKKLEGDDLSLRQYEMKGFKKLSGDNSGLNFRVYGGGSSNKYGTGAGGRIIASKNIDKNTAVEAYADVGAFKPKDGSLKKEVKGYNLNVTKRFKSGGVATGMMPPNNAQQKQQIGGSMTPGMMNVGGMPKKKKAAAKKPAVPSIMIAIAVPAKKGKVSKAGKSKNKKG